MSSRAPKKKARKNGEAKKRRTSSSQASGLKKRKTSLKPRRRSASAKLKSRKSPAKSRKKRASRSISPFVFIIAGLFGFAAAIFGLDFLQTKYGRSSVTVEMFTWAQDKGLFSGENRQLKSEALRKAVNEALIESGVHKSDVTFQKSVANGTPDEYEYREFRVSPSVGLDSLRALLIRKTSREGAGVVAIERSSQRDRRVLAIDLGFGRVKRQCLLLVQQIEDEKVAQVKPAPSVAPPESLQLEPSQAPKPRETAEIALVVDDCGYDLSLARRLIDIDCPMTLSILPRTTNANATAQLAHARGREVMLHLPMEPLRRTDPHIPDLEIRCGQSQMEIESLIVQALNSVPHVKGVNNHEGSRACADLTTMGIVMGQLKKNGLYFVDSRTTADTVAFSVARSVNLRVANRDIFLDNENDIQAIKTELARLVTLSIRLKQPVIGICHLRRKTVAVLEEQLPLLMRDGHRFLLASQVVK